MMNAHVHPIFRDILNDFAATFGAATNRNQAGTGTRFARPGLPDPTPRGILPNSLGLYRPYIVHEFRHGQIVKQRMEDHDEARAELAAIVKNFRRWKHYVVKDGRELFYIAPIDGSWSKTVGIVWQ